MNQARFTAVGLAAVLLLTLAAKSLPEESQNTRAVYWFKIGLGEQDPQKKILAYTKAIEQDPLFVEALYNLGLAYRNQQDYRRAEQFLLRAYKARPDEIKNKMKLQILYELAMTYKKLGRSQDCEDALRGAKNLAVSSSVRANILLELGKFLLDHGRYKEALTELRSGQELGTARAATFANLIRTAEDEQALQQFYEAVTTAETRGDLTRAAGLLEQIKAKRSGFKDVEARITRLDSLLKVEASNQALAALYEQAGQYANQGNLKLAAATYRKLLERSAGYRDADAKLEAVRLQLQQNQLSEKLESDYVAGVAALQARDWNRAILAFERVVRADRAYRDARTRLAQAKRGLQQESTRTAIARYYALGITAMNRNDLGEALAAFEEVRKLDKNYRDVASLLSQVQNALATDVTAATSAAVTPPQADSLYQQALAFLAEDDMVQAAATFEKLQVLQPNYRDVVDRLAQVRTYLQRNPTVGVPHRGKTNTGLYIGVIAVLVALPVLGLAVLNPSTRARICLFRGDYAAAARIYERILQRHPKRLRLYPKLAELYLLLGRNDEPAMKAYRMVLQLNLPTRNREEINSIVAQHYLAEGRVDSDALEVLESALQTERQRKGSPRSGES